MMTKLGVTVSDIGPGFPWTDFRDFVSNLPPSGESALYRAQNPKSWWWTPDMDFTAAVLVSLQWANWQRGGGRGEKPKPVKRPKEKPRVGVRSDPKSAADLAAKKQKLLERRL
jgi:hypothetical protein